MVAERTPYSRRQVEEVVPPPSEFVVVRGKRGPRERAIERQAEDVPLEDLEEHRTDAPPPVVGESDVEGAPIEGRVVTQYPESKQTAKSIDDYRAVALELMSIWANTAQAGG